MCLAIPGKVMRTYREHGVLMGKVDFSGVTIALRHRSAGSLPIPCAISKPKWFARLLKVGMNRPRPVRAWIGGWSCLCRI